MVSFTFSLIISPFLSNFRFAGLFYSMLAQSGIEYKDSRGGVTAGGFFDFAGDHFFRVRR